MGILAYKSDQGRIEYTPGTEYFHSVVLNINGIITFQGRSIDELKQALADSIEEYL